MTKKIKGNRRKNLTVEEVSLVDRPANPPSLFTLFKRSEENDTIDLIAGHNDMSKGVTGMNLEELQKALDDAQKQNEELKKAADASKADLEALKKSNEELAAVVEKAKKEFPPSKEADEEEKKKVEKALKDMPEPVRKRLEEAEAQMAALEKGMKEETEKRIKLEKKLELDALAKKAETLYPNLPGDALQKAELMQTINALPEAQREFHEQIMKSANEALGKTFEPVGKSGSTTIISEPEKKLEQMAKAYQESHKTTYEKAFAEVCDSPEGQKLVMETFK